MAKIRGVGGHPNPINLYKFNITAPADGAETTHADDLPTAGVVLGAWLDVTTAEATGTTKTLDVGLLSSESGGDADGFLVGADVSAVGIVKGTLASAGQTLGALLRVDESGAGVLVPEGHVLNGTAVSISYTAGSADFAELVADLYVLVLEPDA